MSNSYLGGSVEISDFFKDYKSFSLDGKISDAFWGKHPRHETFNLEHLPTREYIPCSNPICKKGGYSVVKIVDKLRLEDKGDIKESMSCSGELGGGRRCTYAFDFRMKWERK